MGVEHDSRRLVRRVLLVAGFLTLLVGSLVFAARRTLTLAPPHRMSRPSAVLSPKLQARVDESVRRTRASSISEAIDAALQITGDHLRFGLDHQTTLSFDQPRAGNCVEYAHFFGTIFEQIARNAAISARVHVVRSYDARIFGVRLPFRNWRDHDWVLVDGAGGDRREVDPAFADALLGYDLKSNVRGLER